MLPFLKLKEEGSASGPIESKEREHDESFDMLDAVAADLCSALGVPDEKKSFVKAALESFADYIQNSKQGE